MKLIKGADRRVHIQNPRFWGSSAGTDYWAVFGDTAMIETATQGDLDLWGWETTDVAFIVGSGADFLSGSPIADAGTIGGIHTDATADFLISPFIFGDFSHTQMVAGLLGYTPTNLNMECYAMFSANSDENATGFGFVEAGGGGGALADADMMAFIGTGGTKFEIIRGDGTVDASVDNVDTDPHLWKITCSGTTAEWFIDGVSQGTITLQDNLWPVSWAVNTETSGTDDPVVSWVHIWYD